MSKCLGRYDTPRILGGSKLGPIGAKSGLKPDTTTQNKAKQTNQIDFSFSLCKQGVAGSSPVTSTKPYNERLGEFSFGAHPRMCMNCAGKDRSEALCTITGARKPLKSRNAF